MRAIVVTTSGGPEVLREQDVAEPVAGPGQILVGVAAAGVNFIDTYKRAGIYPTSPPFVLGEEGAGEILAVGPGVSGRTVGERVVWKDALGSYAEQVVVAASEAVPVPAGLDDQTAAALLLQGLTAQYLVADTYPVRPGDWVVVHAAAGGVGLLLTQLVKARGGHVVATTGGGAKAALATDAGADVVVGYDQVLDAVTEATGGEGVAAVYDGVGAATFDDSLVALRPRGVCVLYGASSGQVPPLDPQRLRLAGSVYLTRPTLGDYTRTPAETTARCAEILDAAASGALRVRIGHRYPLADARRAHEDLEARRTTGKLLLIP